MTGSCFSCDTDLVGEGGYLDGGTGSSSAEGTGHCARAYVLSMANKRAASLVHGGENLESFKLCCHQRAVGNVT